MHEVGHKVEKKCTATSRLIFVLDATPTRRRARVPSRTSRGFLACCEGSDECGKVMAGGVCEKGTVNGTKFGIAACKLGKSV